MNKEKKAEHKELDQTGQEIFVSKGVFPSSGPDGKHAFSNHLRIKQSTAKEKCRQRLQELENALQSFEEAHSFYLKNPDHKIYVMALIQSFEFSFELSWVALKYFIQYKEVSQYKYARDIIKQAFNKDIIKDGSIWLDMLEDRNNLSHVYNESMAKKIVENISNKYIIEVKALYDHLTREL